MPQMLFSCAWCFSVRPWSNPRIRWEFGERMEAQPRAVWERIKLVSSWWKMDTHWYTMILWFCDTLLETNPIGSTFKRQKSQNDKHMHSGYHVPHQAPDWTSPSDDAGGARRGKLNVTWIAEPAWNWFGMAYMAWQVCEYCQSQEVSWATSEIVNWHSSLHVLQGSHHFFTNLNLSCFMHWFSSIYNAKCMHSAISKCEFQRSTTNPEFQVSNYEYRCL